MVSDYAVFGYLSDIFVIPECRGQAIGRRLVRAMLEHPDVAGLKVVLLRTRDAHGVHRPFGFKELPDASTKLATRLKVCLSDPGAVRLTSVLAGLGVPSSRQNMPVGGIVMRKALCAALGCVSFVGLAAGFAAAQQPAAVRPVDAARDKPDFTGVWTNYTAPGQAGGGGRGAGAGAALPFTEEARKKIAAYRALVTPTSETPGGYCLGTGMPGSMLGSGGYPMEIHQRPEQIMIVYEAHSEIRRIYLGDRIPLEENRLPGRNGTSTARWEGDTLVVETTHLREQVDQQRAHSDQARIVERYRLEQGAKGEKVLFAELTMTDPVFYTEPLKAEKRWALVPNGHLLPYECNEEVWIKRLEELERKAATGK